MELYSRKMCNDSKKLVNLYAKVSALSVVESWSIRKVKHPFTSTEIRWTQNSCSKRITQFFSSVCTEHWRIGDINSVQQKKKRDEQVLLWTTRFWPSWNRKKHNSWYLFRHKQLETGGEKTSRASTSWLVKYSWPNYAKKKNLQHLVAAGKQYKIRPDGDDGWGTIT